MPPLNHYVSLLLRRRLPLLIAGMVIGAAVGWVTTPASGSGGQPAASAFRATHTLVANDPSRTVNLDQLAFLAIVGEVPRAAAEDLDATPADLTSRLQISVRSDIQALQISAFDEDGARSAAIADRFASGLLDMLSSQRTARIDELTARASTLRDEQAAADPGLAGAVERQRIQDELTIVLEQLRQATTQQTQLTSVEDAEPVAISETAYTAALDRIRTGGSVVSLDDTTVGGLQALPTADVAADEPTDDEPSEAPRAAVGALVGLIAASALAIALDRVDPRIRTTEDVEQALGTPVLAEIPPFDRSQRGDQVVVHRQPHSRAAEAFRTLRTSIAPAGTFAGANVRSDAIAGRASNGSGSTDRKGAVVLVTSPEPGDGKTTTVVNLAAAFAETGMRVLVIDADFRRPRTPAMLHPQPAPTVADALWPEDGTGRSEGALHFAPLVSPTDVLGIGLLRAGEDPGVVINPSRLLMTIKYACAWAVRHYDVVVVDTAALLGVNDARDVMPAADAVVLVVRRGSSTRDTAAQAGELLHRLAAPLTGAVFVEASSGASTRRSDFSRTGPARTARVPQREALEL